MRREHHPSSSGTSRESRAPESSQKFTESSADKRDYLEKLYKEYFFFIVSYIERQRVSREIAEDVAQTIFASLFEDPIDSLIYSHPNPRAFLQLLARRGIANYMREKNGRYASRTFFSLNPEMVDSHISQSPLFEALIIDSDLAAYYRSLIRKNLHKLTPLQHTILSEAIEKPGKFSLRHFAYRHRIAVKSAEQLLLRAVRRMSQLIAEEPRE